MGKNHNLVYEKHEEQSPRSISTGCKLEKIVVRDKKKKKKVVRVFHLIWFHEELSVLIRIQTLLCQTLACLCHLFQR